MNCAYCDNDKFRTDKVRFRPNVKDEEVEVMTEALVCMNCKQPFMNDEQMDSLRRLSHDAYRRKHGLLTSDEIAAYRKKLGMSQREFAQHLSVGEASIKRWETFYVQDKSQDNLIRLKCDEAFAQQNAVEVRDRTHLADIFRGLVEHSRERVREAVLYFVPAARSRLFVNKALFYADFLHFKRHGRGITGCAYQVLEYGPVPFRYDTYFKEMLSEGHLKRDGTYDLTVTRTPKLEVFDNAETETLKTVLHFIEKNGAKELLDLSHKEKGYEETPAYELISYEFAKKLLL